MCIYELFWKAVEIVTFLPYPKLVNYYESVELKLLWICWVYSLGFSACLCGVRLFLWIPPESLRIYRKLSKKKKLLFSCRKLYAPNNGKWSLQNISTPFRFFFSWKTRYTSISLEYVQIETTFLTKQVLYLLVGCHV